MKNTPFARRYILERSVNTRDLGGWMTPEGQPTQFGRFIRSDAPGRLSDSERARLQAMGITTVVDLRGKKEAERRPSPFSEGGFEYSLISMNEAGSFADTEDGVGAMMYQIATEGSAVKDVFSALCEAKGGALFHCTAGKDRTGIIAALLLALVGVELPDIFADYEVSYTYNIDRVRLMHQKNPDRPAYLGQSKPEYMEAFFNILQQKHGGAVPFLQEHLLIDESVLQKLRGKLLLP